MSFSRTDRASTFMFGPRLVLPDLPNVPTIDPRVFCGTNGGPRYA